MQFQQFSLLVKLREALQDVKYNRVVSTKEFIKKLKNNDYEENKMTIPPTNIEVDDIGFFIRKNALENETVENSNVFLGQTTENYTHISACLVIKINDNGTLDIRYTDTIGGTHEGSIPREAFIPSASLSYIWEVLAFELT